MGRRPLAARLAAGRQVAWLASDAGKVQYELLCLMRLS